MTRSHRRVTISGLGLPGWTFFLPGVLLWMLFASSAAQSATLDATYNIFPGYALGPTTTSGNLGNDDPIYYGLNIDASAYTTLGTHSVQPTRQPSLEIRFRLFTVTSLDDFEAGGAAVEIDSAVGSLSRLLAVGTDYVFSIECTTERCSNAKYTINASAVPLPAAAWLFGSALIGFIMMSNRRSV